MPSQTKTVTLTDAWQLVAGPLTPTQFAGQSRGGSALVCFDGATAPTNDDNAFFWPGFAGFAIPGGSYIWVKGTGTFTALIGT